MKGTRVGFAVCGSFCTFSHVIPQIRLLKDAGADILPIMSVNASTTDTRFGTAASFVEEIEDICKMPVLNTLTAVEPIGPKKLLDILIIAPCTGNTLGKLASGISDTPVTLAAKAHLRNQCPLLIAVSTNDALSSSARNIGQLMNAKWIFFVPMAQDDPASKPASVVADFSQIAVAAAAALEHRQIQPVYLHPSGS